ncbi:MAG: flagellar biosynthesis anti-sigma factor FlgM [Desulfobacterales bacterium]|nr:flagellar biosynthesis anti-sigma factor FlgM [Desulfobacterales bacterium]
MNITETGNSLTELIAQYKTNENKVTPEPEKPAADSVVQEERVSLSSAAKDIQRAEQAVKELPDIREEKVRELQDQIETGKYEVSGEKIAGKMISESVLDIVV